MKDYGNGKLQQSFRNTGTLDNWRSEMKGNEQDIFIHKR